MRLFCITLLLAGVVFGQAPPPAPQTTPTNPFGGADVPDDKVVATIGGTPYTAKQMREFIQSLPEQARQRISVDPATLLPQVFMTRYLASEAKKNQLDKKSPTKEELEFNINVFLANVMVNDYNNSILISSEEQQKYYNDHASDYEQAKVRVIYVAFSSGEAKSEKKVLTEAEAKAKIEDLRKRLQAGGDFAVLAKENSDDKESAEKGGEWGVIKRTSKFPDEVKNAVFKTKAGEVTEPIRQANGFYLIKVDEFTKQPFAEVEQQIFAQMRQERFAAHMAELQKKFTFEADDPSYFPQHKSATPASH